MAIDAKLLVLDEPTLGLDILYRKQFYDSLLNDYFDRSRTIVVTTHQVEEIQHILTDLMFINRGHIVLNCSMSKQAIHTSKAPTALGPYSQAIRAGYTVYLSGQVGIDPPSGDLVKGIEAQTRQVFANLRAVAEAAGGSLDDIVKLTILMVDLADFAKVNDIMRPRRSRCASRSHFSLTRWASRCAT